MPNKMSILECQAYAIENGQITFDLCGPAGRAQMSWADSEKGIFHRFDDGKKIDIHEPLPCGKTSVEMGIFWCENIQLVKPN